MRSVNRKSIPIIMGVFLLCTIIGSFLIVAAEQRPRQRDALAPLKFGLSNAGAAALSSQQEEQLTSLVSAFREERRSREPNTTLQEARRAFDQAVLAGDAETAQSQANIIAEQFAQMTGARLKADADFKIQVLNILNENQKSSLLQRVGTSGLSRLLGRLAGGGRFRGPRGPAEWGGFAARARRGNWR